ncbi:hypothetical protein SUDANB6_02155 [Streptomyces sp. enrichment culture]|uniref:DUF4287 domain-containing protein n=1 Tax=Streptomyces sp. enrichment culture TaxID=1795815 RepID=UPI003F543EDB
MAKTANTARSTGSPKSANGTAGVKGPASYFPSIEKKYGRPVAEWKELIRTSPLTRHMELVTWLKTEHGLGHGHANALVAHTLAEAAGK